MKNTKLNKTEKTLKWASENKEVYILEGAIQCEQTISAFLQNLSQLKAKGWLNYKRIGARVILSLKSSVHNINGTLVLVNN